MKILVACEFSAIVRDAFRRAGHDAWSNDLLSCEGDPRFHLHGDVFQYLYSDWDMMIAHPTCTRLTNSGVRWLAERNLWADMRAGAEFFLALKNAPIKRKCLENPIPHKYAREIIGPYTQIIQPWQFGHGETKATCLWLENLPELRPTNIVAGREARVHLMSPGPERAKERSRFFTGIADAMAGQWGQL